MPNSFDFTDSFSHYSTLAQMLTKWRIPVFNNGGSVGAGFAIGTASQGYRANNNYICCSIPSGASRKFGFRQRASSLNQFFAFWNDDTGLQLRLSYDASGHIVLQRNTTTIATSTLAVTANTVNYIAVEITVDNSVGVFNVWVNGVSFIAFTGDTQNTANAIISQFQIGTTGGNYDYGDVIVYPATMATIMDANVNAFKVNSAGARTVFSRGGVDLGTNWQQISKALAATANFNFSHFVNDRDNFVMDPASVGTLLGARLYAYAQKDNTGLRSIALTVESGATDDIGASQALSLNGYGFYGRDASVDPATAALWANFAALNGAKMGYKITV